MFGLPSAGPVRDGALTMARGERRGVELLQELDNRFFDTLSRFYAMAEIQSAVFQIEHVDHDPVAVVADGVRYPIRPE